MDRLLGFSLIILSLGCDSPSPRSSQGPPVYDGLIQNLMESATFTMYRGNQEVEIAQNADRYLVSEIASRESNLWWLETSIEIPKKIRDEEDIWLFLHSNVNAVEIYLNRHLLLSNGQVGQTHNSEEGGRVIAFLQLPRVRIKTGDLGRSQNKLSLKFSNYQFKAGHQIFDLSIGPSALIEKKVGPHVYGPLFLGGIFLLAIAINLAFFVALEQKQVFLLMTALFSLCFLAMAQELVLYKMQPRVNYWHTAYLDSTLDLAIFGLLAAVLFSEFNFHRVKPVPRNYGLVAMASISLAAISLIALLSNNHALPALLSLIPLAIALFAWVKRYRHGGTICLIQFLISSFAWISYSFEPGIHWSIGLTSLWIYLDFVGLALFAMVMVVVSAKRILHKNELLHSANLRSASLENELLQKHLQPHFLMNSLMALQQLIVTNRHQASVMVEALSEELHLLNRIRQRTLIPLREEIAICRTHLNIMSIQQQTAFSLKTLGITGEEWIPPAVIHTLIENGLTHGYSGRQAGCFSLSKQSRGTITIYNLSNDGTSQSNNPKASTGTGLSYVRARLEESFPGRWQLSSHATPDGWETVLEFEQTP